MVKYLRGFTIFLLLLTTLPVVNSRADSIPERATIEGVSGRRQSYSLSCEARSAVDWAAFYGVRIGEKKFQTRLPRSANPDVGFVGNPNDPWGNIPPASYGVHAEPVADLLRDYGVDAQAQRDLSWDDLRAEIAAGRPVIVWVIGQMWKGTPVQYKPPGEKKTIVAQYEHTMILFGYSPKAVQVLDAYTGQIQTYPLRTFLNSWKVLGHMAVVAGSQAHEEIAANPDPGEQGGEDAADSPRMYLPVVIIVRSSQPEGGTEESPQEQRTYIVRRGDYLLGLAQHFGVGWRALARVNRIEFPYVIHPGQVLKIP